MKSAQIEQLVADLQEELGSASFDVVDHWDADPTAIGLACPSDHSRLVYVDAATPPLFTAILEVAPEAGSDLPYAEGGTHDELTLAELTRVVRSHLRIDNSLNESSE
jgi:hypothetical protein